MDPESPVEGSPEPFGQMQKPVAPLPAYAAAGGAEIPTQRIILEQPGGRWRRMLTRVLIIILAISLIGNIFQQAAYQSYVQPDPDLVESFHSGKTGASEKVAIILLKGTILDGEGFVKNQIDRAKKDDSVKAVVLRVDSPGGTVTGSHFLYHHLKELAEEKPLVVSMGGMAASGGYYVSMAVGDEKNTIFAEPTTWTGSIGVIIPHFDLSRLLDKWHIQNDSISSGPYKQMGSWTRELPVAERKILQELVDESFEDFKQILRQGRPDLAADEERFTKVTTGRIFTAKQAMDIGLVDKMGFIKDAIGRAKELAGLAGKNVRVVKYKRPKTLADEMFGTTQIHANSIELSALLELASLRAYYLCTGLPTLAVNKK